MNETSYAYYQSPIGLLKIGGTEKYISEISFVENQTEIIQNDAAPDLLHQCIEELIEYFNGKRLIFEIPVHQTGTEFQTRVWNELLNIHFGKTVSYMTLAKRSW